MKTKISLFFEYTSYLLNKYKELQKSQEKNVYRIIDINRSSNNQTKLVVQIIGKASIIECYPYEIAAIDKILEGFSKQDIRTITYLACNQNTKPKYKITTQEYSDNFNRMIFKLCEPETNYQISKTASEIMMDKEFIENLSKEDIKSISYIAGYECAQQVIQEK